MWKTALSWAIILAASVALTRYYNPALFDRLKVRGAARPEQLEEAQKPGGRRQKPKRAHTSRLDANNSGVSTPTATAEGKASKKRKLISSPVDDKVIAQTVEGRQATLPRDEDESMDNKAFAQQLAKAQAGTKLESAGSKVVKTERRASAKTTESKQNGVGPSSASTETSSTTDRDADDDLSPVGSPSTGPVSTAPTSRADDVSDMLEAPVAKPSTLRLTNVKSEGPKKAAHQKFEQVLSKKQRQRQAKQAEEKALREESDRLHEAKKQAQLRAARIAEGSSNQTKANSFTSRQNAWQAAKPVPEKVPTEPTHAQTAPLLDTFEPRGAPDVKANGAVRSEPLSEITNTHPSNANASEVKQDLGQEKTKALAASGREKAIRPGLASQASWADEVNQEEQEKWANELVEEQKWEAVTSKRGRKGAKKESETSSEASSSLAKPVVHSQARPTTTKENGVKPRAEHLNRFQSIEPAAETGLRDAEWEA